MKLIYVNELGPDYKNERIYEFIFNDTVTDVVGEDWDLTPASGRPTPPEMRFIKVVGTLCDTELKLELVQNSDYFSVLDAVDGVIALGWESYESGDSDTNKRLVFKYGETLEEVKTKLGERDLKIKMTNIK
jgi:hypothetical protein